MIERIRSVLDSVGNLPRRAAEIDIRDDLYEAGLTSFASVQLMLALEEAFDVEFPERMLTRRTFASIDAMARCLGDLAAEKV